VPTGRAHRELAVILHADVVGSTAFVQINVLEAHERMQDDRGRGRNGAALRATSATGDRGG